MKLKKSSSITKDTKLAELPGAGKLQVVPMTTNDMLRFSVYPDYQEIMLAEIKSGRSYVMMVGDFPLEITTLEMAYIFLAQKLLKEQVRDIESRLDTANRILQVLSNTENQEILQLELLKVRK